MKRLGTLLVMALLLASAAQADSLTTIQLMHRPAGEVIPIVKPMLGPGDAITGQGFRIFLRSSPQTLAQVKEMIDALDVAAKMLQISVFQGSEQNLDKLRVSGNIQINNGNGSASVGTGAGQGAASIGYGTGNVSGSINASSTRLRQENNPVHQLRVVEGSEGYIDTGEQIPYFAGASRGASANGAGSIEYKAVTTGFYVLPRIHGDEVTLQVSPFRNSKSKTSAGNIDTMQASTTITGPIGEWLQIGGASEQINRSQSGIVSHSSEQGSSQNSIWIRADLVR
jgi:type II secretory pathway component GspD/PulD (secretin)